MQYKSQGKSSLGTEANIVALLSCFLGFVSLGIISGVIFYFLEKKSKFVRFYAMQSMVTFSTLFILIIAAKVLPVIGWTTATLLGITGAIIWILLMVKSYEGEYFKLPFAGAIAERHA